MCIHGAEILNFEMQRAPSPAGSQHELKDANIDSGAARRLTHHSQLQRPANQPSAISDSAPQMDTAHCLTD